VKKQDIRHVEIDVEIHNETELGILIFDGDRTAWLPKSQLVDFDSDAVTMIPSQVMTITMPEWLAKAKGLI